MLKTKPIAQHVQDSSEGVSLAEISQSQYCPKPLAMLLRHINKAVVAVRPWWSKQQGTPRPMGMPDLLAGRYLKDVSRHASLLEEPEGRSLSNDNKVIQPAHDPAFPDQRARLFAQLGIKSEETHAEIEDVERLIASLSHIEVKERIDAAHTLADLYERLPLKKQMHARINLILMTWRDVDMYARIAAIKALERTEMSDVAEALQIALRDDEQDVRAAAARALGNIKCEKPVIALIAALLRENEHWSVRTATIQAMGTSGGRVFLNAINLALDDEDDSVRIAAIHALAQLEGLQAAPRLALIAQRDKSPYVKHAAILELENLGTDA
jgi:HEAT repeat protein